MPYYIPNLVSKTTCVGNSLSTFNTSFSSLDTNLYNLSTYTHTTVDYLSTRLVGVSGDLTNSINYLSSTMISVSGDLDTLVYSTSSYLMNEMTTLSSYTTALDLSLYTVMYDITSNTTYTGIIGSNIRQYSIYSSGGDGGTLTWDIDTSGPDIEITLAANVIFANPTNMATSQTGNIMIRQSTSGKSFLSYGSMWTFSNNYSSLYTGSTSRNMISYYYDGDTIRAVMTNFTY